MLTLEGKITKVFPQKSGTSNSGKEWKLTNFIVSFPGKKFGKPVENDLIINAWGDLSDNISAGAVVGRPCEISAEVTSRERDGRWNTDVTLVKLYVPGYDEAPQQAPKPQKPAPPVEEPDDDLPF